MSHEAWTKERTARTRAAEKDFISHSSREVCGGLSYFAAEYLIAFLDNSRKGDGESKEKLMETRAELAKRYDQFAGNPVVEITKLYVVETLARISSGGFDPQSDYK